MNNGWVKLHRQLLDNPVLRKDTNAKLVFITLLLICNKQTGAGTFGREILGYYSGIKPITAYKAFLRLKKAEMVTQSSNNQFTSFSICNWSKFQSNGNSNGNNAVTTREQRGNTLQEEEKNKKNTYKSNDLVKTQSVYDLYIKLFDKNPKTYKLTDKRKAKIRTRLKDAGYEMLVKAIESVADMPFYRGDNDRGWQADLDFIINSYEKVERLSQLSEESKITEGKAKWYYE